jgi:hypothetical protein
MGRGGLGGVGKGLMVRMMGVGRHSCEFSHLTYLLRNGILTTHWLQGLFALLRFQLQLAKRRIRVT